MATIKSPKNVLRQLAQVPGKAVPSSLTRGLSSQLSSMVENLPSGSGPSIPSPKDLVSRFESLLPASAPKFSNAVPDVKFQNSAAPERGITSGAEGAYRQLGGAGMSTRVLPGGYRSF